MPTVSNKSENQALFYRGAFGNRLQSWNSLEEYQASGYPGLVVLRSRIPQSPYCRYHLRPEEVPPLVAEWKAEGYNPANIYVNVQGPHDDKRIFQGEVRQSERHYDLLHSFYPAPMRVALEKDSRYAVGLTALMLLKQNLWPSSFSDLEELFEIYPEHVIEFTAYNRSCGDCRHRNTIIWEVRKY